jgi:hypothetical protein
MTNNLNKNKQKRIKEIEERKIEILLETEKINKRYGKKISKLRSEYSQLDKEQYYLRLDLIKKKGVIPCE